MSTNNSPQDFASSVQQIVQDLGSDSAYNVETIEKAIEHIKLRSQSINALTVVGAFIAAVQASIIPVTFNKNGRKLEVAANAFSFLGLSLDIIGTSYGLIDAMVLQRSIERRQRLIPRVRKSQDVMNEVASSLEAGRMDSHEGRARIIALLQDELAKRKEFEDLRHFSDPLLGNQSNFSERRQGSSNTQSRFFKKVPDFTISSYSKLIGVVPSLAIVTGTLFLLAGVLCFARDTQRRVVWVSCLMVMAATGVFSISATLSSLAATKRNSMQFHELNRKIEHLRSSHKN